MHRENQEAHKDKPNTRAANSPEELAQIIESALQHSLGREIQLAGFQLDLATANDEVRISWERAVHGTRYTRKNSYGYGRPAGGTTIAGTFIREDD